MFSPEPTLGSLTELEMYGNILSDDATNEHCSIATGSEPDTDAFD